MIEVGYGPSAYTAFSGKLGELPRVRISTDSRPRTRRVFPGCCPWPLLFSSFELSEKRKRTWIQAPKRRINIIVCEVAGKLEWIGGNGDEDRSLAAGNDR